MITRPINPVTDNAPYAGRYSVILHFLKLACYICISVHCSSMLLKVIKSSNLVDLLSRVTEKSKVKIS